ncbi:MAG: membrane protein insertion efficiency factor YidD [Deltaproteobacteria bacterium]|nr:membrane protein insertion efficiency factor YidD [Deltaproteobacteria bacterium]
MSDKKIVLILFIFLLISIWAPLDLFGNEDLMRSPRSFLHKKNAVIETDPDREVSILKSIASSPIEFYRKFLSSHWGHSCSHYPSCSDYSLLAIKKHGWYLGLIMTFDRLQHEANEARFSPLIKIEGSTKVYDPVKNNDFWWYTHEDNM